MRAFARGRDRAFDELVGRYGEALKGYAIRMLRSPELAEEVYVETFSRVAKARKRWKPTGTVKGWLFTIAHRLCLDELRRRSAEHKARPGLVALAESRAVEPSAEAQLLLGERARHLEAALQQLPEQHRQVLLLRVIHGLSGVETAEALGIRRAQVDSLMSYARKRLEQLLSEPRVERK